MECKEFFRVHAYNNDKCRELQKLSENVQIDWESQSASEYSPGRVEDEETIFRQVMSPLHFDESSAEFKASLFSDVKDKGLSVNRISHCSIEFLEDDLEKRVAKVNENPDRKEDRFPWGLLPFSTATIRAVVVTQTDGTIRRGLGVYDTAKPDDPSHADVCQLVPEGAQARSVRKSLLDLANAWLKNKAVS